jgi:hypothetical protein
VTETGSKFIRIKISELLNGRHKKSSYGTINVFRIFQNSSQTLSVQQVLPEKEKLIIISFYFKGQTLFCFIYMLFSHKLRRLHLKCTLGNSIAPKVMPQRVLDQIGLRACAKSKLLII